MTVYVDGQKKEREREREIYREEYADILTWNLSFSIRN